MVTQQMHGLLTHLCILQMQKAVLTPKVVGGIWKKRLSEVICSRWCSEGGVSWWNQSLKRSELTVSSRRGDFKWAAPCKLGGNPQQTEFTSILFLDLPSSRIMRNKYLLFKLSSLWYFVITAQADKDTGKGLRCSIAELKDYYAITQYFIFSFLSVVYAHLSR